MLATNIVLLLALIAMVAIFIWLFRDGESSSPPPKLIDKKKDRDGPAPPP